MSDEALRRLLQPHLKNNVKNYSGENNLRGVENDILVGDTEGL